ncbi:gamma-butyrobetaine hydroxylase-like domain-containing protein [Pseudomonas sp. NPDC007930]|uniref:DUF971 domain-containing protein n=1 Tax=Pseudomonas sp. NPDC007930 TaxID=3364417 RepID=UPI0036ED1E4A
MNAPRAIRNRRGEGVLELDWPGQGTQALAHARLRAACPCSACRAARLGGRIDSAQAGVRVEQVVAQGYGVQLVFSDGHARGIYPWAYLAGMK